MLNVAPQLLSVAVVAEHIAVDVEAVLAWIAAGALKAIDVRRPGSSRPRWRIDLEDLQTFLASRRKDATQTSTRRKRRRSAHVTKYF